MFLLVTVAAAARSHPPAVGAGGLSAAACTDRAAVSYSVAYSPALPGYVATRVPIRTGRACAHDTYELTVTDALRHRLSTRGQLDQDGAATADISKAGLDASSLAVALVILG